MHSNLLNRDNTVLIVIDVQEPFIRNIFERERLVTNVIKLVEAAKILGLPIITTLQNSTRMGDVIPQIAEALPDSERIDKTAFSCCGAESFVARMKQLDKKQALICGVETHICVNQTAHDLAELGLQVHVAADAVSSRTESSWHIGLEKMRQSGIIITSVETAIFELTKDAAAPEFKAILELVK